MISIGSGDGASFRPGEEKAKSRQKLPAASRQRMDFLDPVDPPLLLTPVGHGQCGMLHRRGH